MTIHNPEKEAILESDASDFAIAACLSQKDAQGIKYPIAFYSRKLTLAERNYDVYDKELLAIIMALKEWRVYLEGAKKEILIITVHKNLLYFTKAREMNGRQAR